MERRKIKCFKCNGDMVFREIRHHDGTLAHAWICERCHWWTNRCTGRTTQALNEAVKLANEGQRIMFLAQTETMARHARRMLADEHVAPLVESAQNNITFAGIHSYAFRGFNGMILLDHTVLESDGTAFVIQQIEYQNRRYKQNKKEFFTLIELYPV